MLQRIASVTFTNLLPVHQKTIVQRPSWFSKVTIFIIIKYHVSYLATLAALALLRAPVHPVVLDGGLLAVSSYPHITESRLTREVLTIHQDRNTARVGNDAARGALEAWPVTLEQNTIVSSISP